MRPIEIGNYILGGLGILLLTIVIVLIPLIILNMAKEFGETEVADDWCREHGYDGVYYLNNAYCMNIHCKNNTLGHEVCKEDLILIP